VILPFGIFLPPMLSREFSDYDYSRCDARKILMKRYRRYRAIREKYTHGEYRANHDSAIIQIDAIRPLHRSLKKKKERREKLIVERERERERERGGGKKIRT